MRENFQCAANLFSSSDNFKYIYELFHSTMVVKKNINLLQSDWSLLKTNSYCKEIRSGDDKNIGKYDIAGCASGCAALQANLFAFESCSSSKCNCYCQMSTVNLGPCDCIPYDRYDLYQINKLNSKANYQCGKLKQSFSWNNVFPFQILQCILYA